MDAITTITAPVGETFTHSAWAEGDTPGVYDVEVGPRLTFRRTLVGDVEVGDLLMDAFGQPTIAVHGVTHRRDGVRIVDAWGGTVYGRTEVVNVFVGTEPVSA